MPKLPDIQRSPKNISAAAAIAIPDTPGDTRKLPSHLQVLRSLLCFVCTHQAPNIVTAAI